MIDAGTDEPHVAATVGDRLSVHCIGQRVTLVGEIDAGTAPCLSSALEVAGLVGSVDIDLEGVTFMDAAGLRCLLVLRQHLLANGSSVRVVAASAAVQRVLEITAAVSGLRGPDGPLPR
jgi:anti-sigma B factor antagonist